MYMTLKQYCKTMNLGFWYNEKKLEKQIRGGFFRVNNCVITDCNYPLFINDIVKYNTKTNRTHIVGCSKERE